MKFKPEDFHSHQCPPLGDNPRTYSRLAEFVNLRIKQMLTEAPTVFMAKGYGHFDAWTKEDTDLDGRVTHAAKLVCIEELG